ncbi:adenosylcobinamide-GDP ribazoletransferase [Gordonia sp. (in: high G+C Gram-positive bacteria)]|uniref:adenosylcobinamide-GDP ribazoletransferase n=1 Tax=Gordonia sp. (in: high G+C Gram-positive bacteria) TaxID=84139 RepID=UPI003C72048B
MRRAPGALHDAFSWLTVAPVPQPRGDFDRCRGAAVIAATPLVGLCLGAIAAGAAFGLSHTRLPDVLVGTIVVALLALSTRGMHLDGLADTADGLGCYGDPARVREVMRTGDVGPFGAATLTLVLLGQALAFGTLSAEGRWSGIALAVFVGRIAVPIACRRGLPAANSNGFGALVADSQRVSLAVWPVLAIAGAVGTAIIDTPRDGAALITACLVTATALAFAWAFSRHCARRTGGITGDVLGATLELSTVAVAVGLLCYP